MNIALVADWLTVFGGAEHVIAEFREVWPDAPLFTTVARRGRLGPLSRARIQTSTLQTLYRLVPNHQWLLSLMPGAVESIDLKGYDVILSSSHAVGKGIIPPSSSVHVCYCHTPMRYAWEMEDRYLDDFQVPAVLRPAIKRRLKMLRRWDLTTAKRVDVFIANSKETQDRIEKFYGRKSVILPPPVSDRFLKSPFKMAPRSYFLALGRLVPYKRFDLLIAVANAMRFPLKIVGRGQDEARLRSLAGPTVEFVGFARDEDLPVLYGGAKALLFPQYEDAGIVPLEAQACGTPVIAYARGGAQETIKEGMTGLFFSEQAPASLAQAIEDFSGSSFDAATIRAHAMQYDAPTFRKGLLRIIEDAAKRYGKKSLRACK
ncbi:glycosyltransferase [Candidatus Peregrinibacteria bacterium]|nr:glycosyltransferase [Candidatus Peregrinibacteria bacterium]